jgi:hypothetical protein
VKFYRVFPYRKDAAPTERGGALFVPPSAGIGRLDNRDVYNVLYLAQDFAEAAVAEIFGRLAVWRSASFHHADLELPYGLATYEASDDLPLFDLDDVSALARLGVTHASDVLTRDRAKTQAWAKKIYDMRAYAGIRWWSYYKPEWKVLGLWDIGSVQHVPPVEVLTTASPPVLSAAREIVRYIAV